VIVTTHYQRIKELAAEDTRFQIAAMEFVDNRPTYRLRLGSVGESYALEAGRRMNLPENVLERANLLLDDESRRILALQKRLEEETDRARIKQKELDDAIDALGAREDAIEKSKFFLEEQIKKLREGKTDEFLVELHARERELELLIRKAQEVVLQTDMSRGDVEKAIEKVKAEVKTTRIDTEKAIVEISAEDLATPLIPGEPVEEGVTLIVLEKGSIFGSRGIVTQKNKGRGRVFLRVAGVEVKMERHLLGRPHRAGKMGFLTGDAEDENMSAKDRRMMKMLQEDLVDPDKLMIKPRRVKDGKLSGLRMATNTLDIRGHGIAEAQELTMTYFERTMNRDLKDLIGIVYINHGNTKAADAIKPKFRLWLKKNPLVRRFAPAELSDGGDAFTVVELDFAE
jgi:DNA mismatch repair protein MutS2